MVLYYFVFEIYIVINAMFTWNLDAKMMITFQTIKKRNN